MKKPYEIKLELYSTTQNNQNCIQYVQYDNNAYPLTVQLMKDGSLFNMPDDAVIEFIFKLPSEKHFRRTGRAVTPYSAVYDVNYDDITEFGEYTGSVSLILRNGTRLTWQEFTFYVRRSLLDDVRPVAHLILRASDGKIFRCSADKILTVIR